MCSIDHLYKITTCLRQLMLSLPKQIPIHHQSFFFLSQMKKKLSKVSTKKLYLAKKWKTNIRQQYIKKQFL